MRLPESSAASPTQSLTGCRPSNSRGGFASEQSSRLRWQFASGLSTLISGQLDPELAQLPRIDIARRLRHQVLPAIIFREGHDFANGTFAADQHDHSIKAKGDAAVRWRAESKRAKHVAEHRLLLLLIDAEDAEHLCLQILFVDADAAATDLDAVQDNVVRFGADFAVALLV